MILCQSLTTHLSDKVNCIAIYGYVCIAIGNSHTYFKRQVVRAWSKTRTCVGHRFTLKTRDINIEVFLEVYQLSLLGVSTNPPSRVSWYTFDNLFWPTHQRFNKWLSVSSLHQKCVQKVDVLSSTPLVSHSYIYLAFCGDSGKTRIN